MAKRHRSKSWNKIKDPYSIIRQREQGKCYEQKPEPEEEDRVPRKLKTLLEASNGLSGIKKRRAKKKSGRFSTVNVIDNVTPASGMTRPMKPVPVFSQKKNESDRKFIKRVDQITKERLQESRFEDKYNVDVVRDPATGETRLVKRDSHQKRSLKKKRRLVINDRGEEQEVPADKRALRRCKKAAKLAEKMGDFHHLTDVVQFGEVVQRPPALATAVRQSKLPPPSNAKNKNASLLLASAFRSGTAKMAAQSPARRLLIEDERQRAVQAYRQMRANKITSKAAR